jgi:hypothetical protein
MVRSGWLPRSVVQYLGITGGMKSPIPRLPFGARPPFLAPVSPTMILGMIPGRYGRCVWPVDGYLGPSRRVP